MKNYYSLSVSCTVSQLIMRVLKPKVAYKFSSTGKTQGSTLTYYCPPQGFRKARRGTLVTRAYIKGSAYCWNIQSRDGAVVRALSSHQCGPGSNPGVDAIRGLSLLLVLSLAPRGFSPGTPVFPSPQKPTLPNSHSTRNQVDEEPLRGSATFKPSFVNSFVKFKF